MYCKKYKKYCKKAKNLIGGVMPITFHTDSKFIEGWKPIANTGKMNCGIFLNNSFPFSIMKCEFKMIDRAKLMYNRANTINELARASRLSKIYANIESLHEYSEGDIYKLYVIMEKMDGNLGDLITKVIPKLCVNFVGNRYTEKEKRKLLKIFNFKLNSSNKYSQQDVDNYYTNKGEIFHKINILKKLLTTENLKITYENFLKKVVNLLNIVYPIILKKIDKLVMNIYELNYIQIDNHMGNIGYKIHLAAGENLFEKNIYDPNIWRDKLEILFIDPAPHTFLESAGHDLHEDLDSLKIYFTRSLLFDINNLSPSDYRCDILYYIKQNKIFSSKNKNVESHITNILYDIFGDAVFFLQKNYDFLFLSEISHESLESYFSDEQIKYKFMIV